MSENKWRDYSDLKSFLHDESGEVLAEMINGGWDTWMIFVRSQAKGRWVGREAAKAACEYLVELGRPGRIVAVEKSTPASAPEPPSFWHWIFPWGRY